MADNDQSKQESPAAKGGLAAVGIGAFAVVCCASLPLLAVLASSVALSAVLGVGAGILATVALVGFVVIRTRRKRACETPRVRNSSQPGQLDAKEIS